jgi:type I restriction enzyme M protein
MILKKNKVDSRTQFIDATKECVKVTNNNKFTPENINNIVNTYAARAEKPHMSHLASYEDIVENNYNLSVSTYVEAEDTREKIDIVQLNAQIKEIVAREQVLRTEIDKIIAEIEGGKHE